MVTLAASPERVLEPGKVYNLPAAEAKELLAGKYAVEPTDKELRKGVERIPPQPDPEDIDAPDLDDEDMPDDEPVEDEAE